MSNSPTNRGSPSGSPGVDGGFVLLAEPSHGPIEVIALDAGGKEIDREPINYPLVDESPQPPPIERSGHASSGSHAPEPAQGASIAAFLALVRTGAAGSRSRFA